VEGKNIKIEKKDNNQMISPNPINFIDNNKNEKNNIINNNQKMNETDNKSFNLIDFGNQTQQKTIENLNNNNINTYTDLNEKKKFGFLKKKIQNEDKADNEIIVNNNVNDILNLKEQAKPIQNEEISQKTNGKPGFSFIKSKIPATNIISNDKINKDLVNSSNTNQISDFDIINQIYTDSINDINYSQNNNILNNIVSNSQSDTKSTNANKVELLLDKFSNFNMNKIDNEINGNLASNNFNLSNNLNHLYSYENNNINFDNKNFDHNTKSFKMTDRTSNYEVPNFNAIFSDSPDMRNKKDSSFKDDAGEIKPNNYSQTNDQIDFLSELNLNRKK